jgi:hypothetical protein
MNLYTDKRESTNLPIDAENPLIIVPKNVEIAMLCTNLNMNFEQMEKREEARKRKEVRDKLPDKFARKDALLTKKKTKPAPPPIDAAKVRENCVKLERSIAGLEK